MYKTENFQIETFFGGEIFYIFECFRNHYENTPIQIYRKFHLQKPEKFQKKLIYFIFLLKT